MSASSNAGMALNEHRRGARTKHALGAWVWAVQTSALRFFTVCLFGQTAVFNDVYNLMSLGDPHPCMALADIIDRRDPLRESIAQAI